MKNVNPHLLAALAAGIFFAGTAQAYNFLQDLPDVESRTVEPSFTNKSEEPLQPQPVEQAQYQTAEINKEHKFKDLEIQTAIEDLKEEILELRGRLEEQEHQIDSLRNKQQTSETNFDYGLQNVERGELLSTNNTPEQKFVAGTTFDAASARKLYTEAYQQLKNKQYTMAKTSFRLLTEQFEGTEQALMAHYWLGEIYLLDNEINLAKAAFNSSLAGDAHHPKAADATLKLGMIALDEHNLKSAEGYFKQVMQNYPETSAAEVATTQLKNLKLMRG